MPVDLDPLATLRDIHMPPDPGWWPPAPGWWVLAALAMLALWWLGRALRARQYRRRPRRAALRELAVIRSRADAGQEFAAELSQLVRRVALARFPRESVAGLTGVSWLEFLDRTGSTDAFTKGPGRRLVTAPFAPAGGAEPVALVELVEQWIRANT